ncbi:hypothetical protein O988_02565, partial [Pseudogymnoascus sp. VKM F-3808]
MSDRRLKAYVLTDTQSYVLGNTCFLFIISQQKGDILLPQQWDRQASPFQRGNPLRPETMKRSYNSSSPEEDPPKDKRPPRKRRARRSRLTEPRPDPRSIRNDSPHPASEYSVAPSNLSDIPQPSPVLGFLSDILPDAPEEESPVLPDFSALGVNSRTVSPMAVDGDPVNPPEVPEGPDPDSPMPREVADSEASHKMDPDTNLAIEPPEILLIGHSTLPLPSLIQLVRLMRASYIIDIRASPTSEASPQFNFHKMRSSFELKQVGIEYLWLGVSLGGRRENMDGVLKHREMLVPDLKNYAAHMTTAEFKAGIAEVKAVATEEAKKGRRVVLMCEEAVHWRCHRRLIADKLVADGWIVKHMGLRAKEVVDHVMWNIARVELDGDVVYDLER